MVIYLLSYKDDFKNALVYTDLSEALQSKKSMIGFEVKPFKEDGKIECPECKGELIVVDGGINCKDCGYSYCS